MGLKVLFTAVALLLPILLQVFGNAWVRIADFALLYVLLALGLNIVVGYGGSWIWGTLHFLLLVLTCTPF